MLIYKHSAKGTSPGLLIPQTPGVDNPPLTLLIDAPSPGACLYYSYAPPADIAKNRFKDIWFKHDIGALPEFFADTLLGGVTAIKVINYADLPVVIKINPLTKRLNKNG